jgi:hypothetical protein
VIAVLFSGIGSAFPGAGAAPVLMRANKRRFRRLGSGETARSRDAGDSKSLRLAGFLPIQKWAVVDRPGVVVVSPDRSSPSDGLASAEVSR